MQITIDVHTRISALLESDPDRVISALVDLNSKFSPLKSSLLRRLLVKRVSIADACFISKTPVPDFMYAMEKLGFRIIGKTAIKATVLPNASPEFTEPKDYIELDVRPIIAGGQDPLKKILAAVKILEEGQGLKLINTFEPMPLIRMLAEKGFNWRVEQIAPDLVITSFFRPDPLAGPIEIAGPEVLTDASLFDQALARFSKEQLSYIDVRELSMPGPMLAILERTSALTFETALFVYHKKIPIYLLPELEKQGLSFLFKPIGPNDIHMLIFRQ